MVLTRAGTRSIESHDDLEQAKTLLAEAIGNYMLAGTKAHNYEKEKDHLLRLMREDGLILVNDPSAFSSTLTTSFTILGRDVNRSFGQSTITNTVNGGVFTLFGDAEVPGYDPNSLNRLQAESLAAAASMQRQY